MHLFLSHTFKYFYQKDREERKKVIINFLVSYLIFIVISSFWIFTLSSKYGFFTIGTSPNYNHAWMAPDSKGQATEYLGFLIPPNNTAASMWEDLTYYTKLMPNYSWNPLSSWPNFYHQIKLIIHNLWMTAVMFVKFSFLWPIIILFSLWHLFKIKEKKDFLVNKLFLSLVVIILYSVGYTFIYTSDRYLWIACVLLFLMGGLLLSQLSEYFERYQWRKIYFSLILVLFSLTFLFVPIRRLAIDVNQGKFAYDLSNHLKLYNLNGNIASDENWAETSILSFYLGTKYYGIPGEVTVLPDDFEKYNINYYIVWNRPIFDSVLSENRVLTTFGDVTVYKIRP